MILGKVKKMIWAFVIIICCIGVDQITKIIARTYLQPKGTITVIKNFFSFTYVENKGGAWGIFGGNLWLFIIITIGALGAMFYLLKDFDIKKFPFSSIGVSLMLGGTIGNFIDRLFNGFVVDFFDFIIFGYDYPIFNVADICLVVGAIMLILQIIISRDFFFEKKEKIEE